MVEAHCEFNNFKNVYSIVMMGMHDAKYRSCGQVLDCLEVCMMPLYCNHQQCTETEGGRASSTDL